MWRVEVELDERLLRASSSKHTYQLVMSHVSVQRRPGHDCANPFDPDPGANRGGGVQEKQP